MTLQAQKARTEMSELFCGEKIIEQKVFKCYTEVMGNQRARRLTLPISEGLTLQTKERRARHMYVTYAELFQLLIFIVALVDLCYQIFKGKKK